MRASRSGVASAATSHEQPPPPVGRPKIPSGLPPTPLPLLTDPVEPEVDDVGIPPPPLLLLVEVPTLMHWPSWQAWPIGQTTPVHGQLPHLPVSESQHLPPVHRGIAHRSWTQVGGIWPVSQT